MLSMGMYMHCKNIHMLKIKHSYIVEMEIKKKNLLNNFYKLKIHKIRELWVQGKRKQKQMKYEKKNSKSWNHIFHVHISVN